jgi:hypothetical protein
LGVRHLDERLGGLADDHMQVALLVGAGLHVGWRR